MTHEFRLGAVLWGCFAQAAIVGLSLMVFALIVFPQMRAAEEPDFAELTSEYLWFFLVLAAATPFLGGLVAGLKAKGMEVRHALVLVAFAMALSYVAGQFEPALPDDEPQPPIAVVLARETAPGFLVVLGALLAKGVRLNRWRRLRAQGYRACERCEYPMEEEKDVCPRCGFVV